MNDNTGLMLMASVIFFGGCLFGWLLNECCTRFDRKRLGYIVIKTERGKHGRFKKRVKA